MTRHLITGADGFVGQHLIGALVARGEPVIGAVRQLPPALTTLSETTASHVEWIGFDLEKRDEVEAAIHAHAADRVYHLAAMSSVARSLDDPASSFRVNVIGTLYLLTALLARGRQAGEMPTVLIAGSADAYGSAARQGGPISEDRPLEPLNPYAVSKAAQELLGLQFHRAHGLPVILTRSFNHTGPGQGRPFVAVELASQALSIAERGGRGIVRVGDPEIRRDFTDVRDVVRAYVLLAEHGAAGEVYNVCSGRSYAISELVEMLAAAADLRLQIERDPGRSRPAEVSEVVGSFAKLGRRTGWAPEIEFERTLEDLLNWLRHADR